MFSGLGAFAWEVASCELRGQAPWWFWLVFVLTTGLAFEIYRRRNSLGDALIGLFALLPMEFFLLVTGASALGTSDCNAGGPFGANIFDDWDWIALFILRPVSMYLYTIGFFGLLGKTKNRKKKRPENLIHYDSKDVNDSSNDDEGNFRRYL